MAFERLQQLLDETLHPKYLTPEEIQADLAHLVEINQRKEKGELTFGQRLILPIYEAAVEHGIGTSIVENAKRKGSSKK